MHTKRIARAVARRASPSFLVAASSGSRSRRRSRPTSGPPTGSKDSPTRGATPWRPTWRGSVATGSAPGYLLRPLAYAGARASPTRTGVWPALASAIAGLPSARPTSSGSVSRRGLRRGARASRWRRRPRALPPRPRRPSARRGSHWKRSSVRAPRRSSVSCGRAEARRRGQPLGHQSPLRAPPSGSPRGGGGDTLLKDGEFLGCGSRPTAASALSGRNPGAERVARLYRLVADRLQAGSTADRAALLELAARQVGDDAFADHIVPHGAGCEPLRTAVGASGLLALPSSLRHGRRTVQGERHRGRPAGGWRDRRGAPRRRNPARLGPRSLRSPARAGATWAS